MTNETENTGVNPEDFGITSVAGVWIPHTNKAQAEQEDKEFYSDGIKKYFDYFHSVNNLLYIAGRKEESERLTQLVDMAKKLFADPEDLRYYRMHPDEMIGDLLMIFITMIDLDLLGVSHWMVPYFNALGEADYLGSEPMREIFMQRQIKDITVNRQPLYNETLMVFIRYFLTKKPSEIFQAILSGAMISVPPQKMLKPDIRFLRDTIYAVLREK